MDSPFDYLFEFEDWFLNKLIVERKKREMYIKRIWDFLDLSSRSQLLAFLDNNYLLLNKKFFIDKNYDDMYFIIKEKLGLDYEKIREWNELTSRENN